MEQSRPALPAVNARSASVVMACSGLQEAGQVSRLLSQWNAGCLVMYVTAEEMVVNAPAGAVALVILATDDSPAVVGRTVRWLRDHWPRCPIVVVGNGGCGQHEMAARQGGALFLARPVGDVQWRAILAQAFALLPEAAQASVDGRRAGRAWQSTDR